MASGGGQLAWSAPNPVDPHGDISGISCASTQLCVAVDEGGHIAASTRPADGTGWTLGSLELAGLSGISCPTAQLCVAAGTNRISGGGKTIVTSSRPTAGTSAWTEAVIEGGNLVAGFSAISCPSASFCAAVGGGSVYTSTDPAGGPGAWSGPQAIDSHRLTAVSCVSASLCVAVDHEGGIFSSANPAGGASAWKAVTVEEADLSAISCPTAQLCVAAGSQRLIGGGRLVAWSTNPISLFGIEPSWKTAYLGGGELAPGLTAISCPSELRCVAAGRGEVLTSTDPTAGAGAWSEPERIAEHGLTAASCPLNWFCAATDEAGNAYTGLPIGSGPPLIEAESVSSITPTDATLEAQINTEGLETTFTFYLREELPPCLKADPPCLIPERAPMELPSGKLLGSLAGQSVSADLNSAGISISPGVSYEYWVTATNAAGVANGQPQSFTASSEAGAASLDGQGDEGQDPTPGVHGGPALPGVVRAPTCRRSGHHARRLRHRARVLRRRARHMGHTGKARRLLRRSHRLALAARHRASRRGRRC